jgi:hypothetical protein
MSYFYWKQADAPFEKGKLAGMLGRKAKGLPPAPDNGAKQRQPGCQEAKHPKNTS